MNRRYDSLTHLKRRVLIFGKDELKLTPSQVETAVKKFGSIKKIDCWLRALIEMRSKVAIELEKQQQADLLLLGDQIAEPARAARPVKRRATDRQQAIKKHNVLRNNALANFNYHKEHSLEYKINLATVNAVGQIHEDQLAKLPPMQHPEDFNISMQAFNEEGNPYHHPFPFNKDSQVADLNNKSPFSKRLGNDGLYNLRNKGVNKLTWFINTIINTLHEYPFEVEYIILKFQPVVLYPRAMPFQHNSPNDDKFNCALAIIRDDKLFLLNENKRKKKLEHCVATTDYQRKKLSKELAELKKEEESMRVKFDLMNKEIYESGADSNVIVKFCEAFKCSITCKTVLGQTWFSYLYDDYKKHYIMLAHDGHMSPYNKKLDLETNPGKSIVIQQIVYPSYSVDLSLMDSMPEEDVDRIFKLSIDSKDTSEYEHKLWHQVDEYSSEYHNYMESFEYDYFDIDLDFDNEFGLDFDDEEQPFKDYDDDHSSKSELITEDVINELVAIVKGVNPVEYHFLNSSIDENTEMSLGIKLMMAYCIKTKISSLMMRISS
jgi:hypothetical protein